MSHVLDQIDDRYRSGLAFALVIWLGWLPWFGAGLPAQQWTVEQPPAQVHLNVSIPLRDKDYATGIESQAKAARRPVSQPRRNGLNTFPPLDTSFPQVPNDYLRPGFQLATWGESQAGPPQQRSLDVTGPPQLGINPLDALPEAVIAVPPAPDGSVGLHGLQQPSAGLLKEAPADKLSNKSTVPDYPEFFPLHGDPAIVDPVARRVPYQPQDFLAAPPLLAPEIPDPLAMEMIYRGKFSVPVQRPWVEWGRPLYTGGIYPRGIDWFGKTNLIMPHFMVYGDFRTGAAVNRNVAGDANVVAGRLNLDMDLEITATERIHAFIGPMDRAGDFTRFDFTDGAAFVDRTDMRFDTLFFEGDAGAILGGVRGSDSPFDLPFTFGFIPLIYQNGVWANDNVIGAAVALPSRHNRLLNWSNYDATFFWASDQVTTDAFPGDNNAGEFFGTAWFIDAYEGYLEANYAFVNDDTNADRSYHNLSFAFTRRYFARVSNSIRIISNLGQSVPVGQETATGHLLILENSLISVYPNTFVPYFNLFYGQGRPQSLARAGIAGGVLNNTGINFENDGLTGYPTLDPTGHNTFGGAAGLNIIGASFSHQLILEFAALAATGSQNFRNAEGDQYALGMRYQKPLNHAWLIRTDHMYGWLRNAEDIRGSRVELRWKF